LFNKKASYRYYSSEKELKISDGIRVSCYRNILKTNIYYIIIFIRLIEELISNTTTISVHVEWAVSRKTDIKDASGITVTDHNITLPAYVNGEFNPVRQTLVDMLSKDPGATNATVILQNAFPKFLKVTARSISVVTQLMEPLRLRKHN